MPGSDRRRVVVEKVVAGDPTFMLQFSLESQKEKKVPLRINLEIGADINHPTLTKVIEGVFPVDQNIRIMCSYSGSLKHVNIPANVCFSLLKSDEMTAQTEAKIYYDNIKKVAANTISLKKEQTVHLHYLDGNEDDHKNEVFLTYTPKTKKKVGKGLVTRDFCISTDTTNNWEIKEVNIKGQEKLGIKRYWIKNKCKYLTVGGNNSLSMSTKRSEASMWICQEARTERYGQKISIYAIKHHVNNTYLLCDTQTGKVFLQEHSLPVFPWYLHPEVTNEQ